jgi:hypothetical protein
MEELIKKMSSISLEDPDYALLYYRATRIDPNIKGLVAQNKVSTNANTNMNSSGVSKTTNENAPGKAAPGTRFYHPPNTPFHEQTCFGCGKLGHSIPFCEHILKLVKEGRVTRTGKGQIT